MAKWITLAIVAGLFFSVGLFAGNSVPFTRAVAKGVNEEFNPGRRVDHSPAGEAPLDSTAAENSLPIAFVSHPAPMENPEFRSAEVMDQHGPDPEHRRAIRNLIQQQFPHTDAVATEIWVETYAEMSLDEITFVLEQKRRSSNKPGAGLSGSWITSMPSLTGTVSAEPLPSSPEIAVRMVETNLRSAYSLGFRRTVVLPETDFQPDSGFADKPRSSPVTSFRSFESGMLIGSPVATHVALTKENSTMFCLEGNRLTRRGDFQPLADRRLGIVTSSEEIAAAESTPLPEGATDVRISQNGIIQFKTAAGEDGEAGRIAVCNVTDLAELRSDDGVFFTVTAAADITRREDASAFLRTHTLEQSNVDRSHENSLLSHLKSMNNPSVE